MSEKGKRQEGQIDVILLVLVLILVVFGLVMLFSASEYNLSLIHIYSTVFLLQRQLKNY